MHALPDPCVEAWALVALNQYLLNNEVVLGPMFKRAPGLKPALKAAFTTQREVVRRAPKAYDTKNVTAHLMGLSRGGDSWRSPFLPPNQNVFRTPLEAISEALAQEVKALGIRVAIIQPGIIDMDTAQAITHHNADSSYPHERRLAGLFTASLRAAAGPGIVGEKIREVIEDDAAKLRHPVGPDSLPSLEWRAGMSDERWIDRAAVGDDDWYAAIESDFGLDARS